MDNDQFSWANPTMRARLESEPANVLKDRGINVPAEIPLPVVHEFIRITHLLWVNGKITPIDQFTIDPSDEGLLFGRGVWESTRTVNGIPWLWNLHINRLEQTAKLLNMPIAAGRLPDSKAVTDYVASMTKQDVVIRLNATAGQAARPGLVWMSATPLPVYPQSVRLKSVVNPVQKGQAYLTLKTFQYATRLRLGQQAGQAGFDSALVIDGDGNLQEASHANLFVKFDDGWFTPKADGGLLPGTVRQLLLEKSPIAIKEAIIPKTRIPDIREAFVTNSNIGVIPVVKIDDRDLPIGADTTQLVRWTTPPAQPGPQYRFVNKGGIAR